MSFLVLSRPRLFPSVSAIRLAGGGAHPGWSIPEANYHKYTYQPTIPDKHFNIGHYNYAPITLWLRSRRPTLEHVFGQMWGTTCNFYSGTIGAVLRIWHVQLPGFGLKCMGFLGMLLGYNLFVSYILERTDTYFTLEKLKLHETSQNLWHSGFFSSESEDIDDRMQKYNMKSMELEQVWEDALAEATETRDFAKMCDQLSPDACAAAVNSQGGKLMEPISWRFNMMPYGRGSPDAKTFPDNGIDSPGNALFFWGDIGSTGDYIERKDNKMAVLKKARHLYTGAYIPPTK